MRDQYKLIQESNPMFHSPKNDEQDDECVTTERNLIKPILSSDSLLELESDVGIDDRDVEETCGDSNEGTLKNTTQLPGNTNILSKNIRESSQNKLLPKRNEDERGLFESAQHRRKQLLAEYEIQAICRSIGAYGSEFGTFIDYDRY